MTTSTGRELVEIRRPIAAGIYYYLGDPTWSTPSKITVKEQYGTLMVIFKEGLRGSKLNDLWPIAAKWFVAA